MNMREKINDLKKEYEKLPDEELIVLIHRFEAYSKESISAREVYEARKNKRESDRFKTIKFIGIATLLAAILVPIGTCYYSDRKQSNDSEVRSGKLQFEVAAKTDSVENVSYPLQIQDSLNKHHATTILTDSGSVVGQLTDSLNQNEF